MSLNHIESEDILVGFLSQGPLRPNYKARQTGLSAQYTRINQPQTRTLSLGCGLDSLRARSLFPTLKLNKEKIVLFRTYAYRSKQRR